MKLEMIKKHNRIKLKLMLYKMLTYKMLIWSKNYKIRICIQCTYILNNSPTTPPKFTLRREHNPRPRPGDSKTEHKSAKENRPQEPKEKFRKGLPYCIRTINKIT